MKWALSDNHLDGAFVTPPSLVAAAAEREAMRARYRALMVAAHRTTELPYRAALQASAAALRHALYASGGDFGGAVLVLVVEGDETHTYDDGDTAPLHCTIKYMGPAVDLGTIDKHRVISTAQRIGDNVAPFTAKVNAAAQFGPDGETEVKIVEAPELNTVHDLALDDPTVRYYGGLHDEHPQWIPHVTGLDDRDEVRFDRVAAFMGGRSHIFPLVGEPDDEELSEAP